MCVVSQTIRSRTSFLDGSNREDVARWEQEVDTSASPDVYYRPAYVLAYKRAANDRVGAVRLQEGSVAWIIPLLIQPISDLPWAAGVPGTDAITPYGYGGILPVKSEHLDLETCIGLLNNLREWCCESGVVSLMLRLHPLLRQGEWLSAPGSPLMIHNRGLTAAINLLDWKEETDSPRRMSKGRLSDLSMARRELDITLTEFGSGIPLDSEAGEHLRVFQAIYNETMTRLQASDFYFFPPTYYEDLAAGLGERMCVALAWRRGEPVGGAIFFRDQLFSHYHLSGTTDVGRALKATTLLITAGAEWSRRSGCRLMHLGGGVTENDSLFQFKRSFGGATFEYSFATMIADEEHYRHLTNLRRKNSASPQPRPDFFPTYRA